MFSATNYCNQYDNDGAILVLVREATLHPETGEEVTYVREIPQVIRSDHKMASANASGWLPREEQYREASPMRTRAPVGGALY